MARKSSPTPKSTKSSYPHLPFTSERRTDATPFYTTTCFNYLEKAATYLKNVVENEFPKDVTDFSFISLALQKFLLQLQAAENADEAAKGNTMFGDAHVLSVINAIFDNRTGVAGMIERLFTLSQPHGTSGKLEVIKDPALLMNMSTSADLWKLLFLPQINTAISTRTALAYVAHYVINEVRMSQPIQRHNNYGLIAFLLFVVNCQAFNPETPTVLSILLNFAEVENPGGRYRYSINEARFTSVELLRVYSLVSAVKTVREKLLSLKTVVSKQVEGGETDTHEISTFRKLFTQYTSLQALLHGYIGESDFQLISGGVQNAIPVAVLIDHAIADCFVKAGLTPQECGLSLSVVSIWADPNARGHELRRLASELQFDYVDMGRSATPFASISGSDAQLTALFSGMHTAANSIKSRPLPCQNVSRIKGIGEDEYRPSGPENEFSPKTISTMGVPGPDLSAQRKSHKAAECSVTVKVEQ